MLIPRKGTDVVNSSTTARPETFAQAAEATETGLAQLEEKRRPWRTDETMGMVLGGIHVSIRNDNYSTYSTIYFPI